MWRSRIPKLKTTFPSEVLVASDKRSYSNLTFGNVLARRGSSFCYFHGPSFFVALRHEMAARKGCRIGQKMSYRFSFCYLNSFCAGRSIYFNVSELLGKYFHFNSKTQRQMFSLRHGRHVCVLPKDTIMASWSVQSSTNLGDTLLRIAREWQTPEAWFLTKLFILQSSIISQILAFFFWILTIFILITWLVRA